MDWLTALVPALLLLLMAGSLALVIAKGASGSCVDLSGVSSLCAIVTCWVVPAFLHFCPLALVVVP